MISSFPMILCQSERVGRVQNMYIKLGKSLSKLKIKTVISSRAFEVCLILRCKKQKKKEEAI